MSRKQLMRWIHRHARINAEGILYVLYKNHGRLQAVRGRTNDEIAWAILNAKGGL